MHWICTNMIAFILSTNAISLEKSTIWVTQLDIVDLSTCVRTNWILQWCDFKLLYFYFLEISWEFLSQFLFDCIHYGCLVFWLMRFNFCLQIMSRNSVLRLPSVIVHLADRKDLEASLQNLSPCRLYSRAFLVGYNFFKFISFKINRMFRHSFYCHFLFKTDHSLGGNNLEGVSV